MLVSRLARQRRGAAAGSGSSADLQAAAAAARARARARAMAAAAAAASRASLCGPRGPWALFGSSDADSDSPLLRVLATPREASPWRLKAVSAVSTAVAGSRERREAYSLRLYAMWGEGEECKVAQS